MAERMRKRHQDDVRKKIQADKLIRLLTDHAHGISEMSATQIQSAKILLDKSISNAPQEIIGAGDNGEHLSISRLEVVLVEPKN